MYIHLYILICIYEWFLLLMNPLNLKQNLKLPAKYQDNWKLGQALWVMGNTCTCIVGGVYWAALELRAGHKPWEPPWSARNKSWRSPRTGGHHCLTWQHMSWEQSVWGPEVELLDCTIVLILIFLLLFSIVATPIYIATSSVWRLHFLHMFASTCYFLSFW